VNRISLNKQASKVTSREIRWKYLCSGASSLKWDAISTMLGRPDLGVLSFILHLKFSYVVQTCVPLQWPSQQECSYASHFKLIYAFPFILLRTVNLNLEIPLNKISVVLLQNVITKCLTVRGVQTCVLDTFLGFTADTYCCSNDKKKKTIPIDHHANCT
jgi:hypothetical protein